MGQVHIPGPKAAATTAQGKKTRPEGMREGQSTASFLGETLKIILNDETPPEERKRLQAIYQEAASPFPNKVDAYLKAAPDAEIMTMEEAYQLRINARRGTLTNAEKAHIQTAVEAGVVTQEQAERFMAPRDDSTKPRRHIVDIEA